MASAEFSSNPAGSVVNPIGIEAGRAFAHTVPFPKIGDHGCRIGKAADIGVAESLSVVFGSCL